MPGTEGEARTTALCGTCGQVWDRTHKRCPRCKTVKPLTDFSPGDGYCRPCRQACLVEWAARREAMEDAGATAREAARLRARGSAP
jgi:hypothetical protein